MNENDVSAACKWIQDLLKEYELRNIYNMDEKGVLLGIGGRIAAFTDRDQKVVYQIDDGD